MRTVGDETRFGSYSYYHHPDEKQPEKGSVLVHSPPWWGPAQYTLTWGRSSDREMNAGT